MPSDPDSSNPGPPPDASSASGLRRWGRRLLWSLGGLLGTVVLILGLGLLALQTETGATSIVSDPTNTRSPIRVLCFITPS